MKKQIRHELFFPHPPAFVWDYLTKPELIAQWLMKSNFEPIVGHEFQFRVEPKPQLDFDGIFHCKVLELIPFKKLTYSWKFGSGDGKLHDSEVNWTLKEKDGGTELLLVHQAFDGTDTVPLFAILDNGWIVNMEKMKKRITETINDTTKA